jgi:hypothetical protein
MSLAAAKYITKYIHKGANCSMIEIQQQNEVSEFRDCQYISASEAAWHLLEFPIHHHYPMVVPLQIHLPGQHLISFNPNKLVECVMERAACEESMLTKFFAVNRLTSLAR